MTSLIKEFQSFIGSFLKRPPLVANFSVVALIFFFLPGQNFYQTQNIIRQNPPIRTLPFELPSSTLYPLSKLGRQPPFLTAKSVIIMDIPSAVVIYSKNPQERLSPASTTKIMTALVAIEEYKFDQVLTVKTTINEGRVMGLKSGEQLTAENLLYATLVHSANDAAYALAENYPGGVKKFIEMMNWKAKKLGMINTHFSNVIGFEKEDHYVSSNDLARLSLFALNNSDFLRIVSTPQIAVTDVTGRQKHKLENVNELLGKVWGVYGIKTGWTENAGECLVTAVERNGHKILIVLLGSHDRFGETAKIIDWVFANFTWVTPSIRS